MENTLEIIEESINLDKSELLKMLNTALLDVKKLEKKLKIVEEISNEYLDKINIEDIDSAELIKEIKYRPNIKKLYVDEIESISMDYVVENLDLCEEYLIIPLEV